MAVYREKLCQRGQKQTGKWTAPGWRKWVKNQYNRWMRRRWKQGKDTPAHRHYGWSD